MEKGFDDFIKEKYEEGYFGYNQDSWEKLKSRLYPSNSDGSGGKPGLFLSSLYLKWTIAAAGLIISLGISILYYQYFPLGVTPSGMSNHAAKTQTEPSKLSGARTAPSKNTL